MKSLQQYISEKKESYFYGIKPYKMIWHGEWSDPEITDGEKTVNYYDVEDSLYDEWKTLKKEGYTDKEFEDWMSTEEAKESTKEYFDGASAK